jgi:subtilisin
VKATRLLAGLCASVAFALVTSCGQEGSFPTAGSTATQQVRVHPLQAFAVGAVPPDYGWYWVRYASWPDRGAIDSLRRFGLVKYVYASLPVAATALPPAALGRVRALPGVVEVSAVGPPLNPVTDVFWGVTYVGAPLVWSHESNQGSGIRIGFMDTGIDSLHPDLQVNYKGGYNAVYSGPPLDDYGHGTMVAGVLSAAWDGLGVTGVAPQASLYAIKVCKHPDSKGNVTCPWTDMLYGIDWARSTGVQVMNVSLGACTDSGAAPVRAAFDSAYNQGMVIVAAAGNETTTCDTVTGSGHGYTGVLYPAKWIESVIAVSAVNQSGNPIAGYRYGPEIEVAAPGQSIASDFPTYLQGWDQSCTTGSYPTCTETGTSFAAPHVAGVAALTLWSGAGTSPALVRQQLHSSSTRINDYVGYGIVYAPTATTILARVTGITGPHPVTSPGNYTYTAAFAPLPQGFPPIAVKWVVTYSNGQPADSTNFQFMGANPTHVVPITSSLNNFSFTMTATPRDTLGRVGTPSVQQIFVCFGGGGGNAPSARGPGPNKVGGC